MSRNPDWLPAVRGFCHGAGIGISGWGQDTLIVEAKSPERARELSVQLRQFGFEALESEDDAYAGLLTLSRNPQATRARELSIDVSRRWWRERVTPFIWAIGSFYLIRRALLQEGRSFSLVFVTTGILLAAFFFEELIRLWGWRIQIEPGELGVRRWFRWRRFRWQDIRSVESVGVWRRGEEGVILRLSPSSEERLGYFDVAFARILRDRLRHELAQHQSNNQACQ
jgi:PAS domain-containing protein